MTCRYYPQVLAERFSEHRFREDTAAMTQMPILITLPPETTRHCPDTTTVRIMRGVGAVVPLNAASAGPWEVWDAVARARLHAVNASHEQAPVFVGTSCLRLMAYTGGPRIQRSPSTAPTDGAPRCCRPVASVQRLFQKHRCRVHRSLPSPQHASPWTDWSRSTLTMLSFVARFMRILWKHSSWDAWRSTHGASSPCLVKTSADNAPRKSGPTSSCDSTGPDRYAGIVALVQSCRRSIRVAPTLQKPHSYGSFVLSVPSQFTRKSTSVFTGITTMSTS